MSDLTDRAAALAGDTLAALSFFSRVPVELPPGAFRIGRIAGGWPLAGLIVAVGPAAAIVVSTWLGIPAPVMAFLAVAVGIAMTGALHEDGLADTFDAFGARGDRQSRLAVMRDSRLGTFGALALLLALLVKGSALAALAAHPPRAVLALLAAAMASRALALWHWRATAPARRDGLAFSAGVPDQPALTTGLLSGLAAAIVLLLAFGGAALLGLLLAALAIGLFSPLATRAFGGHTGDTIGAAQQVAEMLLFVGLSSVSAIVSG